MRCLCLSYECKCYYIFRSDWEALYIFQLFQSQVEIFIFTCEDHDEAFGNHPLKCMLRSYSSGENRISRSDSGTRFITRSFRKSSNERCTNHFTFNCKLFLYVTLVLLGRNSGINKSNLKETPRTWYQFGCVCNPHGANQNFLLRKQGQAGVWIV